MKAKSNVSKQKMEDLIKKIRDHPHHQLILGISTIICLFLIMMPLYNVYSAEEPVQNIPITQVTLGNESYGNVIKEGPYGNTSSPVKVAYILGEHPREYLFKSAKRAYPKLFGQSAVVRMFQWMKRRRDVKNRRTKNARCRKAFFQ